MAPEKAPAFQFYPSDFLTDGKAASMTLMERGAYITLICHCWIERTLPADRDRLARLVGSTPAVFARLWPALEPCFRGAADDPSRLVHPRLEKERRKQDDYRQRQSNAGRASAAARQQPEVNHGSTGAQPEGNSSVFDLRTSVEENNGVVSSNEEVTTVAPVPSYENEKNARKAMAVGIRRPYQRVSRPK